MSVIHLFIYILKKKLEHSVVNVDRGGADPFQPIRTRIFNPAAASLSVFILKSSTLICFQPECDPTNQRAFPRKEAGLRDVNKKRASQTAPEKRL